MPDRKKGKLWLGGGGWGQGRELSDYLLQLLVFFYTQCPMSKKNLQGKTGRFNIVNRSVLPNLIYKVNAIPIKIPASYFVDIDKLILKFIWRGKKVRIANTILKMNRVRELTLLDIKTYCKATIIKPV